uniref:Uncharacterized protein n=1 Tax=Aegilops tauschii subsp. strangulata TaxID=200361 RepID=A0A453DYE6_AEGTS
MCMYTRICISHLFISIRHHFFSSPSDLIYSLVAGHEQWMESCQGRTMRSCRKWS